MLNSADSIRSYLLLAKKSEMELRSVCEAVHLDTKGNREELIDRLLKLEVTPQFDISQPQAIPLRTRYENGQVFTQALQAVNKWRRDIATASYKDFILSDSLGKTRTICTKYLTVSTEILGTILKEKYYDPRYAGYGDIINILGSNPDRFEVNIIEKKQNRKSFVMLHIQMKRAA